MQKTNSTEKAGILFSSIFKLGLMLGLFGALNASIASAASLYAVDQTTATVGTAQNYEIEYTIDTGVQTWADADTLTVTLPANFPIWDNLTFTVENDGDAINDGTAETAITAGVGNGQFTDDNARVLTIKYDLSTWGAVNDDAETLRILITAGLTPTYAGATSTVTFGGTTAAAGDTNPSGTDTVNVSAANAAATITLSNPTVGNSTGTATVAFTITSVLSNTDFVVFTMPSWVAVTDGAFTGETDTFTGAGSFDCTGTAATGFVICLANGVIDAGTGTIVIAAGDTIPQYVPSSGINAITSFNIEDGESAEDIGIDSTVDVTAAIAADTAASITVTNITTVGTSGSITLTITNPIALATGDKIAITFPANYDISAANTGAGVVTSTFTGTPTFTATVSGQVLTLTSLASVPVESGKIITIPAGIVSSYVADASTITTLISDTSASNATIATATNDTIAATVIGDLTSTNITPESLSLSTISPTTFTFTTTAKVPTGAKIVIVYPSGWILAGASGQTGSALSGLTGTWTASVSGQTLTLTKSGGSSDSAGVKSLTLNGIMTPPNEGNGGTYSLTTKTSSDANIETDATVTADTIIGKVASNIVVGSPTNVRVTNDSGGGLLITWTDPSGSGDATKDITILKGTAPLPVSGTQYALVLKGTQKYVDADVRSGDIVTYQLRASNGSGETGVVTTAVTFTVGSSIVSTADVADDETAPDTTFNFTTQNDSGLAGTVEFTDGIDGNLTVAIALTGHTDGLTKPAHIHSGTCAEMGAIKYNLTDVVAGVSTTNIEAKTWAQLAAEGDLIVNVHKSVEEMGVSQACAVIATATATNGESDEAGAEDVTEDGATDEDSDSVTDLTDIATHWAKDYVTTLFDAGIVKGKANGNYEPDASITRAEFLKIVMEAFNVTKGDTSTNTFKDAEGHWGEIYIEGAFTAKLIGGFSDGTFKPDATITRAEAVKILLVATDFEEGAASAGFTDVKATDWFAKYVNYAAAQEIVAGYSDNTFKPHATITRGEVAKIVALML